MAVFEKDGVRFECIQAAEPDVVELPPVMDGEDEEPQELTVEEGDWLIHDLATRELLDVVSRQTFAAEYKLV